LRDVTQPENADPKTSKKPDQLLGTHKGTGFVRFKSAADAKTLLDLSLKLEQQLNQEREKKDKLSKSKNTDKALLSSASLLKGELELNGRRLVVMSSVSRGRVDAVVKENKDSAKGVGEDRRNLMLKKEGLLNEKSWIHQEPALQQKDLEQRQRLFTEKDAALKKSPNLSVSRVRLQLRNLPKRDFYENELRALLVKMIEAYCADKKKINPAFKDLRPKAAVKQVKVLRDTEKTHVDEASGQVLK